MNKKSLKIPKGQSESIYRTDNTIVKRKKVQRTNNDQQNIHISDAKINNYPILLTV
jgi:hypothetical protein